MFLHEPQVLFPDSTLAKFLSSQERPLLPVTVSQGHHHVTSRLTDCQFLGILGTLCFPFSLTNLAMHVNNCVLYFSQRIWVI